MTKRQTRLIRAEIRRHLAMAHVATDAQMQADHLAVAGALRCALAAAARKRCSRRTNGR